MELLDLVGRVLVLETAGVGGDWAAGALPTPTTGTGTGTRLRMQHL
jgi:hypothetical protein